MNDAIYLGLICALLILAFVMGYVEGREDVIRQQEKENRQ